MFLAVVNESTLMPEADLQKAVGACAAQLKLHVAPAWDMVPAPIIYYADKKQIPKGAEILTILDSGPTRRDSSATIASRLMTNHTREYSSARS